MATIQDIINNGTDLIVGSSPIPEPLGGPLSLPERLQRFDPDLYSLSRDSHLFRYLVSLVGDSGAGSLKKNLLYPRLQSLLGGTFFTDLDLLYGDPLFLPRLSPEIYTVDPKNEALTKDQWLDVMEKDASYRHRCLKWMRAIISGGTPNGIKLAAEAALGVNCLVFEYYQHLDAVAAGISVPSIAHNTSSRNEFIIYAETPSLTQEQQRDVANLLDKIKPVNSVFTVTTANPTGINQAPQAAFASSEYFEIKPLVTGRGDVNWPSTDSTRGFWIVSDQQQEAPNFAFNNSQEYVTYLPIQTTTASDYHIGSFNSAQQKLFSNLTSKDPIAYLPSNAIAPNAVVLQTFNKWIPNVASETTPIILINDYYPMEYFNLVPLSGNPISPTNFWASNETLSGTETLTLDFGSTQQVNYIDFEITQKPISLQVSYSNDGVSFTSVTPSSLFQYSLDIPYIPSTGNPWNHWELHFDLIQARYIQVSFTRGGQVFPFPNSNPFPWSVEVRNLRLAHVIGYAGDILFDNNDNYIPDQGVDLLGNSFTTSLSQQTADLTIDSDDTTFWLSQPNPTPFAVESLYFDVRGEGITETAGNTTIGGLKAIATGGFLDVSGPYVIDADPTITKLTGYIEQVGSENTLVRTVIYLDNNGTPGDLIATSNEVVIPVGTPAGWVDFTFEMPVEVSTGSYWLGYWYGNDFAYYYYNIQTNSESFMAYPYSSTGDASPQFLMPGTSNSQYSLYATYMQDAQPQLINEIYIKPLTIGQSFHIYYSDDDTQVWDNKLWTPVNAHYILKEGIIYLPFPILTKYIKFEFSNLQPLPYNMLDYPTLPPITYNKFPTWVQDLFQNLFPTQLSRDSLLFPFESVNIDPISFGFITSPDALNTTELTPPPPLNPTTELTEAITDVTSKTISDFNINRVQSDIAFHSSFMYQEDLLSQLNPSRALSRVVQKDQSTLLPEESLTSELPVPSSPQIDSQTTVDPRPGEAEKRVPTMWFPYQCRHGYQVVQSNRSNKVAYFVGVKTVNFYRRDYTKNWDNSYFTETLDDTVNISQNDYVQNDWRYLI